MTTRREEVACAAGFFDGEGNVRFDPRPGRRNGWCQMTVAQIDRRVLDRFQAAVGVGVVYGPYKKKIRPERDYYQFSAQGFQTVQAACAVLWPWLSPVKVEQVRSTLLAARHYSAPKAVVS